MLGEVASALAHQEQALALYSPQKRNSQVSGGPVDLRVPCLSYAAFALWVLGYPDQALNRGQEALTLTQELSHPFSLAFALNSVVALYQMRREAQKAQERNEALINLCTEQGFSQYSAYGTFRRGWVLAAQGQVEAGIAQMQQGIVALQAIGTGESQSGFLRDLAEAYGKIGRTEEGLNVLAGALDIVDKTGERVGEAALYRLKGELTLQFKVQGSKFKVADSSEFGVRSLASEAEECFLKAIEIARRQEAKSWELRAVMSLSRLWQQQGKKKDAHQLLSEIYGWFTEGFDTADLKEAKALLDALS
jgi:predicted ATPase